MNFLNKIKNTKYLDWIIFAVCITFFIAITLYKLLHHIPWRDEAHAYNIARYLTMPEIFRIVSFEGHPFVWFLLLKPFAKYNLFYPYPMQILNYIFLLSALIIMWIYAPFNKIIKILITFSFPFLNMYPIVARCYSIGILGMFILTALFPKKNKYPLIYSIVIFITANTNIFSIILASCFSISFLGDLFKNFKTNAKKSIIPLLVLLFTAFIVLFQFLNTRVPDFCAYPDPKVQYIHFFFDCYVFQIIKYLSYIVIPVTFVYFLYYISDSKKCLFLTLYSFILVNLLYKFVYAGTDYHYYFLYIYFIIFYWLYLDDNCLKIRRKDKIFSILFIALSLLFCFKTKDWLSIYNSEAKTIAKDIEKIQNIENIKIFSTEVYSADTLPYIKNKSVKIVNFDGNELYNYQSIRDLYLHSFVPETGFYPQVSENDISYLLILERYSTKLPYDKYKVELIKNYNDLSLYKITPKK